MKWPKRQRLAFIARQLSAAGRLNCADIMREFGVSRAQASLDLRDYQAADPTHVIYDASAKCFRPGPGLRDVRPVDRDAHAVPLQSLMCDP